MCVALPALPSLFSKSALAAPAPATTPSGAPLRMAYLYHPNGANMDAWRPKGKGSDFELNMIMEPLADLKSDIQVVSGFKHDNGEAGPDGAFGRRAARPILRDDDRRGTPSWVAGYATAAATPAPGRAAAHR